MTIPDEAIRASTALMDESDSDVYAFSGWIGRNQVMDFVHKVHSHEDKRQNATLILTTYGGDAHEAYRFARCFMTNYTSTRLLVVGHCKSAGTLVAAAASEIAFGLMGELGPLDVQVIKPDDMVFRASGLDSQEALAIVTGQTYSAFKNYLFQIIRDSEGAIATKTAGEIACSLAVGMVQPLVGQVDPQRLGEIQRMMDIAKHYGKKLGCPNLKPGALQLLLEGYPSHSIIIDKAEAESLFKRVDGLSDSELELLRWMPEAVWSPVPPDEGYLCMDLAQELRKNRKEAEDAGDNEQKDPAVKTGKIDGAAGKGDGVSEESPLVAGVDLPSPEADTADEKPS